MRTGESEVLQDPAQNSLSLEHMQQLEMLEGCWFVDFLVNHLINIGNPYYRDQHNLAGEKLDQYLMVKLYKPIWLHWVFSHVIIANHETGIHPKVFDAAWTCLWWQMTSLVESLCSTILTL
ncbi:hypothetical protein FRC12_016821 [Ceratobasidium sp. 428]|nr:hypothetical protein FRC12_016821 [Ceratobasidium sp. 428]